MEQVGVEAVVAGLQQFLGDMKQVNNSLNGIRPSGTLLEQMFSGIGEAIGSFGREVLNVAEITLGVLLRDAINGIIGLLGDLVKAIFETGDEFQRMKIRLTGLNLNDTADGIKPFNQAMAEAVKITEEEISWLQTLGATTPFDPKQIADTYTQARAFGFTSDEAKRLTKDIIDYTAAMGLSNETLFLVIQNLGQMVQRGKITGTEIRDLARGSFLPLNDVLQRIAENMGITVKELTKEISSPAGIPASEFVKAFEQMVEEEPRFIGAAGRLSRALVPAFNNVKELLTSIFGLNVATPIFDVLGEKVASLVDAFVSINEQGDVIKTGRWDNLVAAATNLGIALKEVIQELLGFLPTSESLADGLINGVQGLATWIRENKEGIVGFFKGIGDTIVNNIVPFVRDQLLPAVAGFGQWVLDNKESILGFFTGIGDAITKYVIPFVNDQLIPAFNLISAWVTVNKPLIDEFFASIGEIAGNVLGDLLGGEPNKGEGPLKALLDGVREFMEFVTTHEKEIAQFVEILVKIFVASQILAVVFNVVVGVIATLIGLVLGLIGALTIVDVIFGILLSPIVLIIANVLLLGAVFKWLVERSLESWGNIKDAVVTWATETWASITTWVSNTGATISQWAVDTWASITGWVSNTVASIVEWKDKVISTVVGWVTDFLLEVDKASGGSVGKFLYFTGATFQVISDWKDRQIEKITSWAVDTKAKIDTWATDTWTSISTWATNTWTSITDWSAKTWGTITSWTSKTTEPIVTWSANTKSKFDEWSAGVQAKFAAWKDGILATLAGWRDSFLAKINEFKDSIVKKFSDIGTNLMKALHDAIVNSAAWVAKAAANAAEAAYHAALAVFGIKSPSKVFMEMGVMTMEGLAIGIQKYAGMAAGVMSSAMRQVAAPALSMPSIIQSVVAPGGGGAVSNTNNRNYNLTVNSGASTEPIVQDFQMLQSLSGA